MPVYSNPGDIDIPRPIQCARYPRSLRQARLAAGVPARHPAYSLWRAPGLQFGHLAHHADPEGPADPASAHMQHDAACAPADEGIYEVVALMKPHRVKRVVVCTRARDVIGMSTHSDPMHIFLGSYRDRQG